MINPPLVISRDFIDTPYFANLGVLQNAAVLRGAGNDVQVLDFFSQENSDVAFLKSDKIFLGSSFKKSLANVEEGAFTAAVVGINAFLNPHVPNPYLKYLAKYLKKDKKIPRIVFSDCYAGGVHYIDYECGKMSEYYPEVDSFIKYETEEVLRRNIDKIENHEAPGRECLLGDGRGVDLNALPYPAWDLIDSTNYFRFLRRFFAKTGRKFPFNIKIKVLPAMATRGCHYRCVFCANSSNYLNAYRRHDIDSYRGYVTLLKKKYKIQGLVFLDNAPNLDPLYFRELLRTLNEAKLYYDFPNGLRADRLEKEDVRLMKNKITLLSISAESGSQYVIDRIINKHQSIESVERVAGWCRELGIPLFIHYVIGFPGEGRKEINETLNHALSMAEKYNAIPSIQFATPLPGTQLYEQCRAKGMLPEDTVGDYSEFFTKKPLVRHPEFKNGELVKIKQLFDVRLNASDTKKLIVNLTYRCNNRCVFCAVGDREKTDADYEAVKEKLRSSFLKGIKWLDIDGGEPTLHDKLLPLIRFAKTVGYEKINVTTNGRSLDNGRMAKSILHSGITGLLVSLHGHTESIHKEHTQFKESFRQTVSGIRNVMKQKPDSVEFGVNTTLTKFNYRSLPEFLDFIETLGVKKVNIQCVTPFGRATKDILPPMPKTVEILKAAIEKYEKHIEIHVVNIPACFLNGHEKYALDDVLKAERNMVFIPEEEVNLAIWLGARRVKEEKCHHCVYNIVCGGFYAFNERN